MLNNRDPHFVDESSVSVPVTDVPVVYTYRYMWQVKGSDKVNFKILSDTADGLKLFEDSLLKLDNLERAGKEYLHQYDCSLIGLFTTIFGGNKNEKD